jgi:hypothetical protein
MRRDAHVVAMVHPESERLDVNPMLLMARVTPDDLRRYLTRHGYTLQGARSGDADTEELWEIWARLTDTCTSYVYVPLRPAFRDYGRRVLDLLAEVRKAEASTDIVVALHDILRAAEPQEDVPPWRGDVERDARGALPIWRGCMPVKGEGTQTGHLPQCSGPACTYFDSFARVCKQTRRAEEFCVPTLVQLSRRMT